MTRNRYYAGPVSDHFDGTRFFNPRHPSTDRSLAQLLRWQLGRRPAAWPARLDARPAVRPEARVDGLRVTLVGHASVLVQIEGRNLLIDPVWSERASPLGWVGPKRIDPPAIAFDDLPKIDAVLVTHNHYDHLDRPTLRRLWTAHRAMVVTPLGNAAILDGIVPPEAIRSGDWGDAIAIDDGLEVAIVPANHWSARSLGDRRMALWSGFVVRCGARTVYNVGDTGYGDGHIFRELQARHGAPDVAIVPIGAYAPRWFMQPQHVDPDEAVRILFDCGAHHGLGVHWGTFPLADDGHLDAKTSLADALRQHRVAPDRFVAMQPGDAWSLDERTRVKPVDPLQASA